MLNKVYQQFQCDANMFTSCALFLNPTLLVQADIVLNVMQMQQHFSFDQCINDLQLDGQKIYECMEGTLGTILQLVAEKESILVLDKIQGVPTVTFNKVIDPSDSATALDKFCELVQSKLSKFNLDN